MALSKSQRAALFAMFGGRCAYCGNVLPEKKWHADHIRPVVRESTWARSEDGKPGRFVQTGKCFRPENERLNNYFPACIPCNIDKSCEELEIWRAGLEQRVAVCRRNHAAFRHAERFGLVKEVETRVIFHFERIAPAPKERP